MTYYEVQDLLTQHRCITCIGRGKVNDAEPGDIAYSQIFCPVCKGSGFKDGFKGEREFARKVFVI